jgi:hypothetical protein
VIEGGAPKSQCMSGVRARVTLPDLSQGPGESLVRVLRHARVLKTILNAIKMLFELSVYNKGR